MRRHGCLAISADLKGEQSLSAQCKGVWPFDPQTKMGRHTSGHFRFPPQMAKYPCQKVGGGVSSFRPHRVQQPFRVGAEVNDPRCYPTVLWLSGVWHTDSRPRTQATESRKPNARTRCTNGSCTQCTHRRNSTPTSPRNWRVCGTPTLDVGLTNVVGQSGITKGFDVT